MSRNALSAIEREQLRYDALRDQEKTERDQVLKGESMRTVTGTAIACISEHSSITPDELHQKDGNSLVASVIYFTEAQAAKIIGWTRVGTAEITLHIDDQESLIANKVESLESEIKRTQADAEMHINKLRGQINNLLALEYKP